MPRKSSVSALASSSLNCPNCAGTRTHADTPGARKACKEAVNANKGLKATADARKAELTKNARQVGGSAQARR